MRKTTKYFDAMRQRPDRLEIQPEWIEQVIAKPEKTMTQKDGRIRKWGKIPEMSDRYLRVIILSDGETLHNAFFDRGFKL
ncbi:MAG: hypothetical protein V3S30_09660 [Thermoanaerobaculia bacterium]